MAEELRIGITGHRDLREEDLVVLRIRLRAFFEEVKREHPDVKLTLLSPLAEGADRLAAEIAEEMGVGVVALLPMPSDEYEHDFESEESLQEYRTWLHKVKGIVEIPLHKGSTLENIRGWGEPRAKQYVYLGAYTVRYSHLLLALWNGEEPKLPGGTAEVVQFKLQGIPADYEPKTQPFPAVTGGLVYQIVTPRKSNSATVGEAFSVVKHQA